MDSHYASVNEQAGIFAGKEGVDITVGSHTELTGAVIASEADKEKNRLETGSLGWSAIENKADYNVTHNSVGVGTGSGITPAVNVNRDDATSNLTHSAIADGTLVIIDTEKQTQSLDELSRDTDNAHSVLTPIFDKQKEQDIIDSVQLVSDISQKVTDSFQIQLMVL